MTTFDSALMGVFGVLGTRVVLNSVTNGEYSPEAGRSASAKISRSCWATVRGYTAREVGGAIQAGDREVTLLASPLNGVVPTIRDRLVVSGRELEVTNVSQTEEGGRVVSWILSVRG